MPNHRCVCPDALDRCDRCDVLLDFPSLHLVAVTQAPSGLMLEVESCDPVMGCPGGGVIATGHGRVVVEVIDAPWAGRPVRIRWCKRRWICLEGVCEVVAFVEQDPGVCAPRGLLSTRAIRWAIRLLRYEGATVQGLARQLGTTWNTVWSQVRPVLIEAANDPVRLEDVQVLGVDEHIWHHRDPRRRGPKELTGMVDLTRGPHPTARLLDLIPGRSGKAYRDWLDERGDEFRKRVEIATLDPFQGYKNAIDDQLEGATCVLDAFHIVKLAGAAVDDVRRRIQQEALGRRGRKGEPLYGIRHVLRAGRERLTPRQQTRLASAFAAHPDHVAVEVAYQCAQDVRDVFRQPTPARGRRLAEQLIERLPSCPIPEIARLGKTLRRWKNAFLAYFDTDGASNGGTEAINGIIELGRCIARGFRNVEHYRLRMLLITGGLDASPHTQL
ncbi:ISL3 family transposase [Helcobacillus massiliensis]|uniref:ISL3 family transposase n=1 Tax=Helcobacillus massiliensis TaxID=521392 RepID=UPI0025525C02|nr:ISL3 family transposase [Helcobacillus massiliensis]MDK7741412.1 ISL3 family transposase [Helcobacillus massiliensis]WOO92741.1 ISL3 family transposase [Helcobacillus massiliensis]